METTGRPAAIDPPPIKKESSLYGGAQVEEDEDDMTKRKCKCECKCPNDNGTFNKNFRRLTLLSVTEGPTPFGPNGVSPYFVQIANPSLYEYNEDIEEKGKAKAALDAPCLPFPEDTAYPTHADSDNTALTPVYRNGQKGSIDFLATKSFHGASLEYSGTPQQYYDWDGVTRKTIFFPSTYTAAEATAFRQDWFSFVFPNSSNGNRLMRGLKQLYDKHKPFINENKPTISEFEKWNLITLNHFRDLLSLPGVVYDEELFLRSRWSSERKSTTIWDGLYPTGTCPAGSAIHCGSTFVPTEVCEQIPYWNDRHRTDPKIHTLVVQTEGSEEVGTFYFGNAFSGFSRKLREVTNFGNLSGHGGPYAVRPKLGYTLNGATGIRTKWRGSITAAPPGYTY